MFQMMTSLESAATNAEVAQIYSVGRNALKSQLGSMKSVDEVDDLVDEIKELIEEVSCCLPNFFYDAAYFDAMDPFIPTTTNALPRTGTRLARSDPTPQFRVSTLPWDPR